MRPSVLLPSHDASSPQDRIGAYHLSFAGALLLLVLDRALLHHDRVLCTTTTMISLTRSPLLERQPRAYSPCFSRSSAASSSCRRVTSRSCHSRCSSCDWRCAAPDAARSSSALDSAASTPVWRSLMAASSALVLGRRTFRTAADSDSTCRYSWPFWGRDNRVNAQ